ncbi:MAG: CBS domain-containing protein [Desulfuromonadales bacterium]|nr:CBS domain-containing protein [Desulfuromonadales bacterium]MDT8423563.1 CBS domain-containing protein [Desulfuromonadales bacterium]
MIEKTIRDILDEKGSTVFTIDADSKVFAALGELEGKNIGALLVMDEQKIAGMFTERDYARKVVLKGLSPHETVVREVMTSLVNTTTLHETVEEAMAVMTDKRCRHLPVFDNNQLVGMVSIGDLVKAALDEKKFIINQLENYIKNG